MRLLIFIAIIYILYRALKSWLIKNGPASDSQLTGKAAGEIDDIMVKDPYCEVYFPKRKGLHLKVDGENLYFCSPKCRDKFIESRSDE